MESVSTHMVSKVSSAQFNSTVGAFLRRRRVALNLSGNELGQALGLSQQQISRYEQGVTSMTLCRFNVFMTVLDFSWNDFFNEVISLSYLTDQDGELPKYQDQDGELPEYQDNVFGMYTGVANQKEAPGVVRATGGKDPNFVLDCSFADYKNK